MSISAAAPSGFAPDATIVTLGSPVAAVADDRTIVTVPGGAIGADDRTIVTAPGLGGHSVPMTARSPVSNPSPPQRGDGDGPLGTGQAFGTRYLVIKTLGIGGMGAVYQVWDAELGHAVALKVIRPEAASDPEVAREMERRFKQELLLARQVTHKNVVRIHDLGEISGVKYITMPYLDGSDLSSVLRKEGKLSVPAALRIIRDVASGLVAAHEAGIVHRDLKPANIMLVGDQAIIMDFGIARTSGPAPAARTAAAASSKPASGSRPATDTPVSGSVEGTVEYMAPEQAKGEDVDQRADLYALGLIFSDMLLGRRKRGRNVLEELKQRIEQVAPPVRSVDPSIPEAVEKVISRLLEPDPAARFQTAAELLADLNRLDANGKPLPIHRVIGMKGMAAAAVVFLALLAGTWWFARGLAGPAQHDPVSVLIADFQNNTGDATFDRTLEPMLKLALETAGFISAYSYIDVSRSLGVRPPERFDAQAARQLAVQQGLGVVISGSVSRQGNRYVVSVKAAQAVTDELIADGTDNTTSKDEVLGVATDLITEVREALGDEDSDSTKRFATETLSAVSLDVVRDYTGAMEALSMSRFDQALQGFGNAVKRDPNFGLAYAGMAITARNLDRQGDAEKYAKEAITHLDGMTERERFRARGIYYYVTGDYQQCAKEYGDLVARYAADVAARNNLALCMTYLRNMRGALDEMRQVVKILPNRALYRENLALYATYSSDFPAGEQEARAIKNPGMFGLVALAFAQLGRGELAAAGDTYRNIGKIDALGASYMSSGLGDIALFSGRFADAERIFLEGIATDVKEQDGFRAASKYASLAYARLARGRRAAAIAAADEALKRSGEAVKIRFLAARVYAEADDVARAQALADGLASELQAEPQAYARIIEGEIALKMGNPRQAVKVLSEANTLLDTWIGHFVLGRAYLEAGTPLQADSEFDRCISRRGEVMSLFLDEEPTYGFLPPLYYYQGRVREELMTAGFADSYRAYLSIRGQSTEDPLIADARKRVGSIGN